MEVYSRKQLNDILKIEKDLYFTQMDKHQKILKITKSHPDYLAWRYTRRMRITSYRHSRRRRNLFAGIRYLLSCNQMNRLGRKLGIESGENVFDSGLRIFHTQGIVVNANARIGKNCRLYGNNCVGNNGISRECPIIGDNVRLCVGAKVIGNIRLADHITVAAGAVVVKSCLESGVTLAGVPARIVQGTNADKKYLD